MTIDYRDPKVWGKWGEKLLRTDDERAAMHAKVLALARREQRRGNRVRGNGGIPIRYRPPENPIPDTAAIDGINALVRFCCMTKGDVQVAVKARGGASKSVAKLLDGGGATVATYKALHHVLRLEAAKLRDPAIQPPTLARANEAIAAHLDHCARYMHLTF